MWYRTLIKLRSAQMILVEYKQRCEEYKLFKNASSPLSTLAIPYEDVLDLNKSLESLESLEYFPNFPNFPTFHNLEMDKHLEVGACPFPNCGKLES